MAVPPHCANPRHLVVAYLRSSGSIGFRGDTAQGRGPGGADFPRVGSLSCELCLDEPYQGRAWPRRPLCFPEAGEEEVLHCERGWSGKGQTGRGKPSPVGSAVCCRFVFVPCSGVAHVYRPRPCVLQYRLPGWVPSPPTLCAAIFSPSPWDFESPFSSRSATSPPTFFVLYSPPRSPLLLAIKL